MRQQQSVDVTQKQSCVLFLDQLLSNNTILLVQAFDFQHLAPVSFPQHKGVGQGSSLVWYSTSCCWVRLTLGWSSARLRGFGFLQAKPVSKPHNSSGLSFSRSGCSGPHYSWSCDTMMMTHCDLCGLQYPVQHPHTPTVLLLPPWQKVNYIIPRTRLECMRLLIQLLPFITCQSHYSLDQRKMCWSRGSHSTTWFIVTLIWACWSLWESVLVCVTPFCSCFQKCLRMLKLRLNYAAWIK